MAQRHDHLFQMNFGDEREAVPLLRSALSPTIARGLDWPSLTRCQPTQRGRRGKRTICDLLFAVRLCTGPQLLLYVVLEHKSRSARFDALQMLEQVTAVLRTFRREHPREPFLPPVLPVVVHADQHPWRSPLQVRDLFDLPHIPVDLPRHLPSLEFVLDDVREQPPEHLRQRALGILGLCELSTLQGLTEGRTGLLRRLLARRFGAEAAKAVDARLHDASIAELDRFADRVLDARSIDDVFAP